MANFNVQEQLHNEIDPKNDLIMSYSKIMNTDR